MNQNELMNAGLFLIIVMLYVHLPSAERREAAEIFITGIFLYWLLNFIGEYPKRRRQRKQEAADENEYWEYEAQHRAIRAKYDPESEWNESTSVPREYRDEISSLNRQHRGMLQRRNGFDDAFFE